MMVLPTTYTTSVAPDSARCAAALDIPSSAGSATASYTITITPSSGARYRRSLTVDWGAHRGRTADLGTYATSGGHVEIRQTMAPAGKAALRLDCWSG
ncbi:hypothetical protein ACL02U_04260 [Streptomyces sp. MS06]|uniref:hypothetical protein n=1 Tax=Streptomyces sp. MS06 TaxID=3385974 RepID=UPI0039A06A36